MDDLRAVYAENLALRARCTTLRAVVDAIPDAVFVKDLHGGYTMINAAGARLLGRSVDEVVGVEDARLFAPESARQIAEIDRRVIAAREALTYEETVEVQLDSRSYLTTKAPFFDEQGRVAGVIGIARDVTAEKKLQADRHRLLDRLRLHIDRLPLAYLVFDADRRVLEWNPAAERIFGYSRDEVLGRDGFELIAPLPLNDALQ